MQHWLLKISSVTFNPRTLLGWRREGLRFLLHCKSKLGRPTISDELRNLIKLLANYILPPKSFPDKEFEKKFLSDYCLRYLFNRQVAVLTGLFTWTIFLLWDYFYITTLSPTLDDISLTMYLMRAIGSISVSITSIIMFTSYGRNEYIATLAISVSVCVCYILLLYIFLILPFPYDYLYYYIGLFLILFFMFGFLRLRSKTIYSLLILLVPLSEYFFYLNDFEGFINKTPIKKNIYYFWAETSYLISFVIVGCAINVDFEKSARITFKRERELEEAKISLEQKNDDTFRFLRDASHDLKNPIHALGMHLHLAINALNKDDVHIHKYLNTAHQACRTLSRSFHSLLDLTALESNVHPIEYSAFCLNAILEDTIRTYQPDAEQHNVFLGQTRRSKRFTYTRSDRSLLSRVLDNLVSNGIKYSVNKEHRNSFVLLDIIPSVEGKNLKIRVIDNGQGIPESEQSNIFKPYHQLHNPSGDKTKGVGLGLSIVKASISRLEDHKLSMISHEDYGTTFIVEVPLAHSNYKIGLQSSEDNDKNTNFLDGLFILLVLDEIMLKEAVLDLLKINGAHCEVAGSLAELIQVLTDIERPPDVVLTDNRLPDNRSAVDVVEVIYKEFGLDVPVIITTGDTLGASQNFVHERTTILKKPVPPIELIKSIKSAIS